VRGLGHRRLTVDPCRDGPVFRGGRPRWSPASVACDRRRPAQSTSAVDSMTSSVRTLLTPRAPRDDPDAPLADRSHCSLLAPCDCLAGVQQRMPSWQSARPPGAPVTAPAGRIRNPRVTPASRGRLLLPALVLAAERAPASDSPRPAVGDEQVARLVRRRVLDSLGRGAVARTPGGLRVRIAPVCAKCCAHL
jgi:hypothetical protein